MNEELNDRLKSRITEVFDNFEDGSAHEGWLLLREKYPAAEKRRPVMWLWLGSVAAVLLVALGIGIWLNNSGSSDTKNKSSIVKNNVIKHTDSLSNPISNQTANQVQPDTVIPRNNLSVNKKPVYIAHASDNRQSEKNKPAINDKANTSNPLVKNNLSQTVKTNNATTTPPAVNSHDNLALQQPINKTTATTKITDNQVKATPDKTASDQNKNIAAMVKEPKKVSLFAQPDDEPKPKKQTVDPKVKFGVYAATYFNYAKGSDNEFNLGAGVSSEIRLTGRLKLLTGIAVGQNSFNYSAAIPQVANHYLAASIAAQTSKLLFSSVAPANSTTSTIFQPVTPVLKNYQASLTGLDIPVNLKYQISKSDTYISAGLSSGTYINETYQYLYNYTGTAVKTQDNNDKSQSSFSTFDFAKTLNLSFGMGYPLGKSNRLIIEPFLKYPLNGLGAQQIRFGASGVNLKLNFSK